MAGESERRMILNMLEEGTITAEEADKLLRALETKKEPPEEHRASIGDEVYGQLPGLLEGALSGLKSTGIFGWGPSHTYEREITGAFDPVAVDEKGAVDLRAAGRNGGISLQGWDSDEYRIIIRSKVRGGDREQARDVAEQFCRVQQEGASLTVDGRTDDMPVNSSVSLECFVPRTHRYNVDLVTSNGRISVEDLKATRVVVSTSNGRAACERVEAEEVEMSTSNGRIQVEEVSGAIKAHTSNGTVRITPANVTMSSQFEAVTSNGRIVFNYEPEEEVGVAFEARTSNGKIHTGWDDLDYEIDNRRGTRRTHVKAATRGFADKPIQLTVDLKTSNGKILLGRG